ncbi:hypothetical protein [Streptosporangium sp. NPDC000239]|uniref:hypothetical protein n=1 Tax=unclassified Streptosporangium TaxID=2632669 RepID=UPI0033281136
MTSGIARQSCEAVQRVHSGWLVFHKSGTGLWSAYRSVLFGRPGPGDVLLVRAGSAEELDRKLAAQVSPAVPSSIRAMAVARAPQARTVRLPGRSGRCLKPVYGVAQVAALLKPVRRAVEIHPTRCPPYSSVRLR